MKAGSSAIFQLYIFCNCSQIRNHTTVRFCLLDLNFIRLTKKESDLTVTDMIADQQMAEISSVNLYYLKNMT